MSATLGLFQKIIKDKCSLNILKDHGIGEKIFNQDEQLIFNFLIKYYREYGSIPPLDTVSLETGIKFPIVPDNSIDYWINRVKKNYVRKRIVNCANRIVKTKGTKEFDNNCEGWVRDLYNDINSFELTEKIHTVGKEACKIKEEHDRKQKTSSMLGIPFGIPYLDDITDGAQQGDTVIICARTGMGKTMLLLKMALAAYNINKMPMVATFEMSVFQDIRRLLAMDASIPGKKLNKTFLDDNKN